MRKLFLFDWGNTIMKDFPNESGTIYTWQKVEAMPGSKEILVLLTKKFPCYLATNAKDSDKNEIIKAQQRVNLDKYFTDVFLLSRNKTCQAFKRIF